MQINTLVIVESPSKCKIIEGYLGDKYKVIASCGHFRSLTNLKQINLETMDIKYTITKSKIIKLLKDEIKYAKNVILATDNDREGESIAWHICDVCNLPLTTPRIIFHEITKDEITNAIMNPTIINLNKVYSQKARQILDLYIGFTISPILWKFIQHKLSAGRCQTPALNMLYEQEKIIQSQTYNTNYKITGIFTNNIEFKLSKSLTKEEVQPFLELCKNYEFIVEKKDNKNVDYNPPSILITSTLQQRCSQYLSMSPKQTMSNAQILYENGLITYMRTETSGYSENFIEKISKFISNKYGSEYIGSPSSKVDTHEGIRVTNLSITSVSFDTGVNRLYEFIYKHTLQSCMTNAIFIHTNYEINVPMRHTMNYVSSYPKFYGWKIVNKDKNDNEDWSNYLNYVKKIQCIKIEAKEQCEKLQLHYTESQLIHQLEKEGIGRPSTYVSILDSIEKYIIKGRIESTTLDLNHYILSFNDNEIKTENEKKIIEEKNKLQITELGMKVIEFSYKYFNDIFDYKYTHNMELFLDSIENENENQNNLNSWIKILQENIKNINNYNNLDIKENKPEYKSIHCGIYKKYPIVIKDGPHGFYIEYKKECISLSQMNANETIHLWIKEQNVDETNMKILIDYIENKNKNVNIIHTINENVTIRKSDKGYYIFYKTIKMKKPKFYSFPNEYIDNIEQIKDYIKKKYKYIINE